MRRPRGLQVMQSFIQAVFSNTGKTGQRLLSVAGTMATLSILASSAIATPPIPSDGEFYDHAAVLRCQSATEEYFGWENVKWDTAGALAFYNEYGTNGNCKGEHVDGTVWADCASIKKLIVSLYMISPPNPFHIR